MAGLLAGVVGLAAYDVTRWGIVLLLGLSVNPFEAFPIFGQLVTGSDTEAVRWTGFLSPEARPRRVSYASFFHAVRLFPLSEWKMSRKVLGSR